MGHVPGQLQLTEAGVSPFCTLPDRPKEENHPTWSPLHKEEEKTPRAACQARSRSPEALALQVGRKRPYDVVGGWKEGGNEERSFPNLAGKLDASSDTSGRRQVTEQGKHQHRGIGFPGAISTTHTGLFLRALRSGAHSGGRGCPRQARVPSGLRAAGVRTCLGHRAWGGRRAVPMSPASHSSWNCLSFSSFWTQLDFLQASCKSQQI